MCIRDSPRERLDRDAQVLVEGANRRPFDVDGECVVEILRSGCASFDACREDGEFFQCCPLAGCKQILVEGL